MEPRHPEPCILTVDTAAETCGAALSIGDRIAAEVMLARGRTHASLVMEAVESVLKLGGVSIEQVDACAVTIGPGSFTGLRIGISTAKGLALALDKPLIGLSSLDVLAHQAPGCTPLVCPMIDARRRETYWTLYSRHGEALHIQCPASVGTAAAISARIQNACTFIGSGSSRFRAQLQPLLNHDACWVGEEEGGLRPAAAARLAVRRFEAGAFGDAGQVAPLYLRPSDAALPDRVPPLTHHCH